MFAFQQLPVGVPGCFCGIAFLLAREKVAALQSKRAALVGFNPSPHRVFPIRGVQRKLPDVVSRRSRTPRRLRSEEHTSELQSPYDLVCRLLLEKKKKKKIQ